MTKTKKQETKGILLLAVGHPYYGRLAHNLAMSLRFNTGLPITLACDEAGGRHLTDPVRLMFDKITEVPQYMTHYNGEFHGVKAKVFLNKLSDYDVTLYMDAENLWLPRKRVEDLFNELHFADLAIQNGGYADMRPKDLPAAQNQWLDLKEVKKAYGIRSGRFYNLFSELIYWRKTKDTELMWTVAQKTYETLKAPLAKRFAGGIPDEAPLAIAMMKTKVYPHLDNWMPTYWWQFHRKAHMYPAPLYEQYYAYSMGGNQQPRKVEKFYNNLAQFYSNKFGWEYFAHKDKRLWAANRTAI